MILFEFLVERVQDNLAQYRDYKRYRASQYILLMTRNGTYGFSVILSLRATLRCERDDILEEARPRIYT